MEVRHSILAKISSLQDVQIQSPTFGPFRFPPEIEDRIFELASHAYPRCANHLAVISKRVQRLVELIIYETMVFATFEERFMLPGMTYAERFETVLRSRSSAFFTTHVRNVCITPSVGKDFVTLFLSKCTSIRHLAVWQRLDFSDIYIVDLITPPSPTLLSFSTGRSTLLKLEATGYIFPSLTELHVSVLPVGTPLVELGWLPALKIVNLRFGQQPFVDEKWWNDVLTVVSTVSQLQTLFVDVDSYCLEEVKARVLDFGDDRIQRPTFGPFRFPPEIEDKIFELASHAYPQYAHHISAVSKRAQQRVEPIIYETIIFIEKRSKVRGTTYAERFETVLRSRSSAFFTTYVRNVCITPSVGIDFLALFFSKCTSIRHLAVWRRLDFSESDIDIVDLITSSSQTLLSFSTGRMELLKLEAAGHIFPILTELHVDVFPSGTPLMGLCCFPALKIVKLRFGQQPIASDQWWYDVLTTAFSASELQTLFVDVDSHCLEEVKARILDFGDDRIHVRDEMRIQDPIAEWKKTFTPLI
ncbi:hypothetical protein H0H87_002984 [Tephrocybe sp. NHM501043]|nr:hypothetical protein H0H87_002984 [Tephrocybe sp. NHM501043]